MKKILVSTLIILGLSGCATGRYISTPTSPPPDLGLRSATPDIEVSLHHVTVPDGPGSWVKGAGWTEWVVSLKNLASGDVSIVDISLIDPRGVYVSSHYASVDALESESKLLAKAYKEFLVGSAGATAIASIGGQAAAQAAIATGSMVPLYGLSYLGTIPSLLMPYMEAQDREAIQAEFDKRRLPLPLRLSSSASVRGSVFFPIVPQPRTLVLGYLRSDEVKPTQLKLPLDQLWKPAPAK